MTGYSQGGQLPSQGRGLLFTQGRGRGFGQRPPGRGRGFGGGSGGGGGQPTQGRGRGFGDRPPIGGGGGNPGLPGGGPSTTPGQGPTGLDAQYYLNTYANQFKTNNQVNALNEQGNFQNTALQSALAQLAYQQPRDQLRAEQNANSRGGLYSSAENQAQGDLAYNFLGREGALQSNFAQGQAARQSQIAGLQGGVPLYDMGQYLAAVQRASVLAQKNPALGQSALPPSAGGHQLPVGPPTQGRGRGFGRLANAIAKQRGRTPAENGRGRGF